MKEIKVVNGYCLFFEPLMKMYIIKFGEFLSLWFNKNDADELICLTDVEFIERCSEMIETAKI